MLSPMSHLPSIRAVGAVVTDVIAPTGNWLLHSLIWEKTPFKNKKLLLDDNIDRETKLRLKTKKII